MALIFIISLPAFGQHHHGTDHPSVHGMLMMGEKKIYISHLPMFHSPHDYQVILEVELDGKSLSAYLKAKKSNPNETVLTLVPEVFVLPEMVKKPRPFKAEVYLGHFERGGVVVASGVEVKLKKVVYFKKFDPKATHPVKLTYLLFGGAEGLFMAHKIAAKPDFDHVIELPPTAELLGRLQGSTHKEVTDVHPGTGKEIYLEHGDLE